MQKYLIFFIAIVCLVSNRNVYAQDNRYQFESGVIEYKMTFNAVNQPPEEINITTYFDQWGKREATYSKTEMKSGEKNNWTNKLLLKSDKEFYMVDLDRHVGMKKPISDENDIANFSDEKEWSKQFTKLGTDKVNGKLCDIFESKVGEGKVWVWRSLPLKMTVKTKGGTEITQIANNVQTDVKIPEDKFVPPDDVQWSDTDKAKEDTNSPAGIVQ